MLAVNLRNALVLACRWLLPPLVVMLGFCVEHTPLRGELSYALMPSVGLMLLMALCIRKVSLLPHWLTFVLLFMAELYAGAVPGTFTIPGLVVRFILHEQVEFFSFAPFFAVWGGAAVLMLLFFVLHWMVIVGFHIQFFDPTPLIVRAAVSAALFPAAAGLAYILISALWPNRATDMQVADRQSQYLQPGLVIPKIASKGEVTKDKRTDRIRAGFRRIQRSKDRKPWMEL